MVAKSKCSVVYSGDGDMGSSVPKGKLCDTNTSFGPPPPWLLVALNACYNWFPVLSPANDLPDFETLVS